MQPLSNRRNFPAKPADSPQNTVQTKTLIKEVREALKKYQSFEKNLNSLEGRVEVTEKKELLSKYSNAISKLINTALEVDDNDFVEIQKFSKELHNRAFTQRLETIESFRKSQTPIAGMRQFLETLERLQTQNDSTQGLPWEQHALGSSPLHVLSEKKALLNLINNFHQRLDELVIQANVQSKDKTALLKLRKELEAQSAPFRDEHLLSRQHLALIQEAELAVKNRTPWTKEMCGKIDALIARNLESLYGDKKNIQLISPTLSKTLEVLRNNPGKLTRGHRKLLLPLLKAAENDEFLKEYLKKLPIFKESAEKLNIFISQHLADTEALVTELNKKKNSSEVARALNLALNALKSLQNMNLSIPLEQPDWRSILKRHGFTFTLLGAGAFGEVFKISRTNTQGMEESYVLKVLEDKGKPSYLDWLRSITGEKTARINHENLIQTIGAFVDETGVQAIIMPYFENGIDLVYCVDAQFLEKHPENKLDVEEVVTLAKQLIQAVKALHAADIIHKDIKDPNIMFRNEADGTLRLVLIDAGLQEKLPSWKPWTMRVAGTALFAAPEVLRREPHGKAADIYSLGVVIYRMLTGKFPREGRLSISSNLAPNLKGLEAYPELKDLLETMLEPDAGSRFTIEAVERAFKRLIKKGSS